MKSPNSHVIVHSLQLGGKLVSVPVNLKINLLQVMSEIVTLSSGKVVDLTQVPFSCERSKHIAPTSKQAKVRPHRQNKATAVAMGKQ